jgi:hypothetical protein
MARVGPQRQMKKKKIHYLPERIYEQYKHDIQDDNN